MSEIPKPNRPPVAIVDTVRCIGCDYIFPSDDTKVWIETPTPDDETLLARYPLCRECAEHAEWCVPFRNACADRALDRLATDRELGEECLIRRQ